MSILLQFRIHQKNSVIVVSNHLGLTAVANRDFTVTSSLTVARIHQEPSSRCGEFETSERDALEIFIHTSPRC